MLTLDEKIKVVDNRIVYLKDLKQNMSDYIVLINNGMEDPDLTIDQCYDIISKTELKIDALYKEKEALTNQQ